MIGVAYMGSWMAPFKFEILNIIVKSLELKFQVSNNRKTKWACIMEA